MLQKIEQRISELSQSIDKSMANHNYLLGALTELKNIYSLFTTAIGDIPAVVTDITDTATAVEGAVSAVETVAPAVTDAVKAVETVATVIK